jgi:serine phosphatase RsbU (regulator of sigma subunit)
VTPLAARTRYSQTRTADVGIPALDELLHGLKPVTYAAGDVLLRQGETSEFALYVAEGSLAVFAESDFERVQLAAMDAPRLIGELGVLAAFPRTATIEATSPVTAFHIEAAQLKDIGRREPDFLLSVVSQLGRQLDGTNRALSLYGNALSALERLEFDPRILEELSHPSPQLVTFANTFKRFADQIDDKRRQAAELASAAVIQRSFLPRPEILGTAIAKVLDLSAAMRPARDVGGDLYDFFALDDHRVVVIMGDVCGKGIPASLFMAVTMTTLRNAGRSEADVASTMRLANNFLSTDNDANMFATLFYGVLDIRTGVLDYANCGHNAPYILSADGLRSLPATGIPIGLMADRPAAAARVQLSPGDALLLYTDGVTEAMNGAQEEFGSERLEALLGTIAKRTPAEIVGDLFVAVDAFAAGAEQADDITCLALRLGG